MQLHLGVDPAFTPARKAQVGFAARELGALQRACSAAGFAPRPDQTLAHARFFVDDPFGNRIEVMEP